MGVRIEGTSKNKPSDGSLNSAKGRMFARFMKTVILVAALAAAAVCYRTYSGIGRYMPLEPRSSASVLMLDTTNGAVYSVEKWDGTFFSTWKETVLPLPREEKIPRK